MTTRASRRSIDVRVPKTDAMGDGVYDRAQRDCGRGTDCEHTHASISADAPRPPRDARGAKHLAAADDGQCEHDQRVHVSEHLPEPAPRPGHHLYGPKPAWGRWL